ncbi:sulfatase-like hydrolase/transferase, partial [bacterium]|nr:sulfatase-like hydrolase/transferase [bacterium]
MKNICRRDFLSLMAGSAVFGALSASLPGYANIINSNNGKKPNILILFTDDQRFDTIHTLGNKKIITPNMDSLVKKGVTFNNAYIMGSMLAAVCAPSRGMLMTGRTLFHCPNCASWRTINTIPFTDEGKEIISFPELFRQAGYTTFATGKQHNGRKLLAKGFTSGDKIFFGGMSDHLKVPVYDFDPTGKYPKEKQYFGEKFSSELFSDAAVRFLRGYKEDNPFLMYVSYTAPHDPRTAPKKYAGMYNPSDMELPENFLPKHPFDNGEMTIRDEKLAPWPRTPDIVREHIAAYYAMITHLDEQIGRVLRTLEETGHADNTIIILAGDNGLAVGQHGLLGKQNLYEHSTHVPLIMCGPNLPQGEQYNDFCYLLDIFPTLCDLSELPVPETVEGKSLVPVITGKKKRSRDSIFTAYKNFQRSVRDGRYKLIKYTVDGEKRTQLF